MSEAGYQTFSFPSGTTLAAGGTLKVVSGKNTQAGTNVLVWTESNIWNNDGDPGATMLKRSWYLENKVVG